MKNFKPTEQMIQAALDVCAAQALIKVVKPIVDAYQQREINIMQALNKYDGSVIVSPDLAYAMNDVDFEIYHANILESCKKSGLKVKVDGNCPLLEAEQLLRNAENTLCSVMKPIAKIDADDCFQSMNGMKNYKELVNLNVSLLIPYIKHLDSLISIAKSI